MLERTFRVAMLAALLGILASGCSISSTPDQTLSEISLNSLEVYLGRASMSEAEFEQYKLWGDKLFIECGTIKRGRHQAKQQEIVRLRDDVRAELQSKAQQVYTHLETPSSLAEAGNADTFYDPGKALITISMAQESGAPGVSRTAKTSVDELTSRSGPTQIQLQELVELTRHTALDALPAQTQAPDTLSEKNLCGNVEFYGLRP